MTTAACPQLNFPDIFVIAAELSRYYHGSLYEIGSGFVIFLMGNSIITSVPIPF